MPTHDLPRWLTALNDEDLMFLKRFVLASGSLKAVAAEYRISYPTVRARLDRLISKVEAGDDPSVEDPFRRELQVLLADGAVAPAAARSLLEAHQRAMREGEQRNEEVQ